MTPSIPYSSSTTPSGTDPYASLAPAATNGTTVNKEMFLQLLVAQIKNQNPLSPADGVQFLTQLAQFTQLEQTVGMSSDLGAIKADLDQMVPAQASATQNQ